MDKEIKIEGDSPEYEKSASELLKKIANCEIKNYILIADDAESVSLVVNVNEASLADYARLGDAARRVLDEIKSGATRCMLEELLNANMIKDTDLLAMIEAKKAKQEGGVE